MANPRLKTPDDLKEFIGLVRKGRLYEVQEWIASGKRYQMPEGNWAMTPLQTAILSGFHSMVELLLKAGTPQREKNRGLWKAMMNHRLDMVQLLVSHGADMNTITLRELTWSGNEELMEWFIRNSNIELEEGYPMAQALYERRRSFLAVFMKLRDQVQSALKQASMALRMHAREGDLKWVSLIMWAGGNPRSVVPDLKYLKYEYTDGTALEDAVQYGQLEVLKKFKVNSKTDDLNSLIAISCFQKEEAVVEYLLKLGADPNHELMQRLISNFARGLIEDRYGLYPYTEMKCLEMAVAHGGNWRPSDEREFSYLRKAICKAEPNKVVRCVKRLIDSHVIEHDVFKRLMDAPEMRKFLKQKIMFMVPLRRLAGYNLDSRGRPRVRPTQAAASVDGVE